MKRSISLLVVIILGLQAIAQQKADTTAIINGLTLFHLGDPIEQFSTQLTCAESRQSRISRSRESALHGIEGPCRGYRFLRAEKDSVRFGPVHFQTLLLYTDSSKTIKAIEYIKSFEKKDSLDPTEKINTSYNNMIDFLEAYCKRKGEIYKPRHTDPKDHEQTGFIWKNSTGNIILIKTEFVKKKDKQVTVLETRITKEND